MDKISVAEGIEKYDLMYDYQMEIKTLADEDYIETAKKIIGVN